MPCDGDCPECGLTIGDSLDADRKSSAWAAAQRLRHQPVGWLRTCRAVFHDREFFRRLDVSGGTRKAIDFAGVTSAIPAAIVAAFALMGGILTIGPPAGIVERIVFPAVLALAGLTGTRLVFFAALSLIGLMVGYRRGVDPRVVTVAVCYGSVRLLQVPLVTVVVGILMVLVQRLERSAAVSNPLPVSFALILAAIPILVLVRAVLQIRRSVRDVVGVGG